MNSIRYRDEDLKLRDGTLLKSRIWMPHGNGPWPITYAPAIWKRNCFYSYICSSSWWASNGYLVVIQDVRGQGGSEGSLKVLVKKLQTQVKLIIGFDPCLNAMAYLGTYGFHIKD